MAETVSVNVAEAQIILSDNTTGDVSTTKHGLAPKAPNDAAKKLDGTGAYSLPTKISVPGAIPAIAASEIQFYLDEANNKLKVTVKYAAGTLKAGEIALT